MKRLYLIRHWKSDWTEVVDDASRPLNPRWKFDSFIMWQVLFKRRIVPDIIYSSPSLRCVQTIEEIIKTLPYPKNKIIYDDFLYKLHNVEDKKDINVFIDFLKNIPDYHKDVFLVWHNDWLNYILEYLVGDVIDISTWWIVCVGLAISSWKDINEYVWEIYFYDKPSNFKNFDKNISIDF